MEWTLHRALSGFYALIVLILSTIVFTLLRPDYNHLEQAFSELGVVGAPNYIEFNFFTFVITGILSLIFLYELKQQFSDKMDKWMEYAYIGACISWICTGLLPASYEAQWLYNVHLAAAFSTFLFGATNITLSVKLFNLTKGYEMYSLLSVILLFFVWGSILMSEVITPELGQLISIFSYFIWQAGYSLIFYNNLKNLQNF